MRRKLSNGGSVAHPSYAPCRIFNADFLYKGFPMDPLLSIIGKYGKESMKGSTKKENDSRFFMHRIRDFYPSKSRAHLKQN
jgi:hypothetical protein